MPNIIQAQGDHFMFEDDQNTPNCLLATFKYPGVKKMLVFEVRHWHTNNELGEINGDDRNVVGNIFMGSDGYMTTYGFNQRGYQTYLGENGKKAKDGAAKRVSSITKISFRRCAAAASRT
jgi:hypothetical protein